MTRANVFAFILGHRGFDRGVCARVLRRELGDVTQQLSDLIDLGMVFEYQSCSYQYVDGQQQMFGVRQHWRGV